MLPATVVPAGSFTQPGRLVMNCATAALKSRPAKAHRAFQPARQHHKFFLHVSFGRNKPFKVTRINFPVEIHAQCATPTLPAVEVSLLICRHPPTQRACQRV